MSLKVGIVRDARYLEHKPGLVHPERPERLEAIHRLLDDEFSQGLITIEPEPATLEQLELVHTPAYIKKILATSEREVTNLAPDTLASAKTYLAAWLAAGGCIKAVEALLDARLQVVFALVRPPGHHALRETAAGFCIFNNLGIAASYAIENYGLRRILIVDWDVHHGNAIQELFYDSDRVVYLSSHSLNLYPYSGEWEEVGRGKGRGYTVNLPLPNQTEDPDILHLYREVLGPIVRAYRPEMIMIAAGFDAHRQDPLGRLNLTEAAFGRLTTLILDLAAEAGDPPLLLALEGGYNPRATADSVREVLKALTGWRRGAESPAPITDLGARLAERARLIHADFGVWAGCPLPPD